MTTMRSAPSSALEHGRLTLEEAACYWAVVRPGTARPSLESLRYAFEPHLPAPIEEIEMRFARVDAQSHLACGVERTRLSELLDAHEAQGPVDSLRPTSVPEPVRNALDIKDTDSLASALTKLEFRSGAFESPGAARWKRLTAASLTLAVIGASLLLSFGAWQRAGAQDTAAASAVTASRELAAHATHSDPASNVDPRLRLAAELRAFERTRDASSSDLLSIDRSADYLLILAAIPAEIPISIDSLEVDQGAITLRGRVREPADYESLTLAVSDLGRGWSVPTGSVSRAREGYTFTIAIKSMGESR